MVTCSGCGKTIEKVPGWLTGVQVEFVCNNCPNRQIKNIALISFEIESKPVVVEEEEHDAEIDVEAEKDEA